MTTVLAEAGSWDRPAAKPNTAGARGSTEEPDPHAAAIRRNDTLIQLSRWANTEATLRRTIVWGS